MKKNGEMGERRGEDEAWEEGKQVPKYRGIKAGKKSTREERMCSGSLFHSTDNLKRGDFRKWAPERGKTIEDG